MDRPDPAVLHAGASLAWLAVASVLGVWLTLAAPSSATLRVAMAYGVFGLVGFLAQIVVGMEGRLLPIFAWYWAYANTGYKGPVPSQHEMPWRHGQSARVRVVAVRRPRAGRRPRLRCHPISPRCRVVFIRRHRRRHRECDPDPAPRVSDATFRVALNTTRTAMLMRNDERGGASFTTWPTSNATRVTFRHEAFVLRRGTVVWSRRATLGPAKLAS
jgi:hypothetical protein